MKTTKRPAKSPPKVRARRKVTAQLMWGAQFIECMELHPTVKKANKRIEMAAGYNRAVPVFVLPATPEAVEQMVEQGAKALNKESAKRGLASCSWIVREDEARALLRALGLAP